MRKPTKVVFMPDWRRENPYQSLLSKAIENQGCDVLYKNYETSSIFQFYKVMKENNPDIIHLHWTNPCFKKILWSRGWKFKVKVFSLIVDLLIIKFSGVKLVWTVHNLISHESPDEKNELVLLKVLAKLSNKIVVHSNGAKSIVEKAYNVKADKISVIRHGNYCDSYKSEVKLTRQYRDKYSISEKDTIFLFIGSIRKYKGVEQLVNAFKKVKERDVKLLIAGNPYTQEDNDWLVEVGSNHENIITDLRFIPEHELASIIEISSVVVLPYIRSLTSGVAILAMSFKKPLIMPNKAKIYDIPGDEGAIYYNSDDNDELSNVLFNIESFNLKEMGLYNYELSLTLDWDSIGEEVVSKLY